MNKIQRKIKLYDLYTNMTTYLPSYKDGIRYDRNSYTAYNSKFKIPIDIKLTRIINKNKYVNVPYHTIFNDNNISIQNILRLNKQIPITQNLYGEKIIKAHTLEKLYFFLLDFIEQSKFFILCKHGENILWRANNIKEKEDNFFYYINELIFLKEIPNENDYSIGDKICVNNNTDEFISYFKYKHFIFASDFYYLAYHLYHDKISSATCKKLIESKPFIDINIPIFSTIDNLGCFTPYITQWVSNKKYYIGDRVYYNDDIYTLVYDENATWSGYDKIEINKQTYDALKNNQSKNFTISYNKEKTIYYMNVPYFKGIWDEEKKITYFDDVNNTHWKKIEKTTQNNGKNVNGKVTSSLLSLQRKKKSFDSDNKLLPFLVLKETINTGMLYLLGDNSINYIDNELIADRIESILFYKSVDTKASPIVFEYDKNKNGIYAGTRAITVEDIENFYNNGYDVICFKYSIGNKLDENLDIIKYGVKYVEYRKFSIDYFYCNYEGYYAWKKLTNEEILNLDDEEVIEISTMPQISKKNYGKIYKYIGEDVMLENTNESIVKYKKNTYYTCTSIFKYVNINYDETLFLTDDSFIANNSNIANCTYIASETDVKLRNVPLFYDESEIGIIDKQENVDVSIDRGTNNTSSFERHNILSEINTFDDLENYRNNFFKL